MALIYNIEHLSENDRKTFESLAGADRPYFGDIQMGSALLRYVPLVELMIAHESQDVLHVPNEVLGEPALAERILPLQPTLILRIDGQVLDSNPHLVHQVVHNDPWMLDRLPGARVDEEVLARALEGMDAHRADCEKHNRWYHNTFGAQIQYITRRAEQLHVDFWTPERARQCARVAPTSLDCLPKHYRTDPAVVQSALQTFPKLYRQLPLELQKDEQCAMTALRGNGELLKDAPASIQASKAHVLCAMQEDPSAYWDAALDVRIDTQVARIALEQQLKKYGVQDKVLEAFPQMLRSDSAWCHQLLDRVADTDLAVVVKYIEPKALLDDTLVRRLCPVGLLYAPVVLHVQEKHPHGLWHMEDLAARACAYDPKHFAKAPPALQSSRAFCQQVLDNPILYGTQWRGLYTHMSKSIAIDTDLAQRFVEKDPTVYALLPEDLRKDPQIARTTFTHPNLALHAHHNDASRAHLPTLLQALPPSVLDADPALRTECMDRLLTLANGYTLPRSEEGRKVPMMLAALLGAPDWKSVQDDPVRMRALVEQEPKLYPWANKEVHADVRLFERFMQEPSVEYGTLLGVPHMFVNDPKVALTCIAKDVRFFGSFPPEVQNERTCAMAVVTHATAVQLSGGGFDTAFKNDLEFVLQACAARKDDVPLECYAASALRSQIRRTQNALQKSSGQDVSIWQAAKFLAAKRTAQADQKALKTAFKEGPKPAVRKANSMGRAL
jgi:hypothetical protein